MKPNDENTRSRPVTAYALLLAASIYVPGGLWAQRSGELNRGYRLGLYAAVTIVLLWAAAEGLARVLGADRRRMMMAVSVGWMLLSASGPLAVGVGPAAAAGSLVMIAGFAAYRLSRWRPANLALGVLAFAVIAAVPVRIGANSFFRPPATIVVSVPEDSPPLSLESRVGDVWLVILDGFPSEHAVAQLYRSRSSPAAPLAGAGFTVVSDIWANFSVSHLSIPSLLDGRYVAAEGSRIGPSEWEVLRQIIVEGGALSRALEGLGYERIVVENGWHMAGCDGSKSKCVAAPLLDEQVSLVLSQNLLGALLGVSHDASFPRGAEHVMTWVEDNAQRIADNGAREFVFVHLMLPHPPFGLDERCEPVSTGDGLRGGLVVGLPTTDEATLDIRRELLLSHSRCGVEFVQELAAALGDRDLLVVVGDHGPDSLGQLAVPVAEWTTAMIAERMLTLAAFRTPEGCIHPAPTSLVEIAPAVLQCVGGAGRQSQEPRVFLSLVPAAGEYGAPLRELTVDEITEVEDLLRDP